MAGDISKSVNVAINIINGVSKQVGSIVSSFGKITGAANKSTKAVSGLNKELGKVKAPAGINSIVKQLGSLGKIDSTGVTKLATGIKNLSGVSFPSFAKINSELATHTQKVNDLVKAYGNLKNASSKVNLSAFTKNTNTANKSVKSLGTNSQKTGASFSQWGYALGSASTGLSKFGTQIYGVTRGFSAVSKEMGIAMAAFTTTFATLFALKGVVSDIVEFDDAIRGAGAVAQASSTQLLQLSDAAREMGESTRYTATDAAGALKALAMTGLEVNDAISTLPTVLNLAAAANLGLGESADIVTNIMVGYGKTVADLPKISDLMTAAFTNSNTSLQELGTALKYVGPVANAAGQSIEETTGILASLANAGYRGSKAGTTLRTAFARLLAPTEKMTKVLDHYGIALSDLTNSDGTMVSFSNILGIMEQKSITAGDALTIFGKRAGPGIISLIGQGSEAIAKMNEKIAESEGTALKAAYEMESGLGGALRKLKSMWEEVSIAIGKTIEKDAQGFIERLTTSLSENVDQIVEVVSTMFKLAGVIAKLVGWFSEFVAEHFKTIAAFAAITAAMKLFNLQAKATIATGVVGYISKLITGLKWSVLVTGLQGATAAMIKFNTAVAAGTATGGLSLLQGFFKSSSGGAMASAATNIRGIGTALALLATEAKAATISFIALNPVLLVAVGVVAAVYAAMSILSEDYSGAAENALKLVKATEEVNRNLKYQAAELGLIEKEYERSSSDNYVGAQERLEDAVKGSNKTIEEKIKLLKLIRTDSDGAAKAIDILTKANVEEQKSNNVETLKNITEARDKGTKALRQQAVEMSRLYGIMVDDKPVTIMEDIGAGIMNIITVGGVWYKTFGEGLEGLSNGYSDLEKSQKGYNAKFLDFMDRMAKGNVTVEQFSEMLSEAGHDSEGLDDVVSKYGEIVDSIKLATEEEKKSGIESAAAAKVKSDAAKLVVSEYKKNNKEREAIEQQVLYNIAVAEAQGVVDHETAEIAKLQATLDIGQQRIDAAKEVYEQVKNVSVESSTNAMAEIVAAEKKAATTRYNILVKISEAEKKANEKITSYTDKRTKSQSEYEDKLKELRSKNIQDHEDAEDTKTKRISEINQTLHDKLRDLDQSLYEKRKKLAEKRVDIIKQSVQSIKDIESSTEDKLRAIRQRGMTDIQKDNDNREAASKKLKEGEALVAEAKRTGDEAALTRGTKLIQQSSEIATGLSKEKDASDGVKDASDALIEADKTRTAIELANVAKKVKAEKATHALKTKNAKEAASQDIKTSEDAYDKKNAKDDKYYAAEIVKANNNNAQKIALIDKELAKYGEKLDLITQEKDLISSLIAEQKNLANVEGGSDVWEKANIATDEAISKVSEYGNAVKSLNDAEVNLTFKGTASPTKGLTETLDNIIAKFAEISGEIGVNVIFKTQDVGLSEGLPKVQQQIEALEINIPAVVDTVQIEAVTKVIDEYRKKDIKVTVDVESRDLNKTEDTLKRMVNKTVTLTTKVIGYDNLVKAKNMIDSIKSKSITVTTKHIDIAAKANGGLIDPEHYATGGDVFKKLPSRFIASGGGKKDDVPAMLMKGEFVQKVSAVKKYGKDFMARLNAGLIPQSVAKMFNSGGIVEPEHYATGGHVGHGSSMKRKKKKYEEELLLKRNEIAGTMNLNVNNKLNGSDMLSSSGLEAISSLKNIISSSISAFASGGSTLGSDSLINLSSNVNRDYKNKISAAKRIGDNVLADIFKKEQAELAKLSAELVKDLKDLEGEYNDFKIQATEEHKERIEELTIGYGESNSDLDEGHSETISDLKKDFVDNISSIDDSKEGSDKEYNEAIEQYNFDKEALLQERRDTELNNAIAHRESITNGHDLGKKISWLIGSKEYREGVDLRGGRMTLEEFGKLDKIRKGPYIDKGAPDFDLMRKMLGDAFPELKSLISGDYKDFLKDASTTSKIAIGGGLVASPGDSSKGAFSTTYANTNYGVDLAKQINELESVFNNTAIEKVSSDFDKRMSDIVAEEEETKNNYNENSKKIETERSDTQKEYDSNINSENSDYNKQAVEYKKDYDDGISDENKSYLSEMSDKEKSYKDSMYSIRESFNDASESVKSSAKEEKNIQKDATSTDIKALSSVLEEELKKLGTGSAALDSKSIFKFLNIPGFNSGGFINNTSTSVPGKDSILAAVAPQEYVMRASVVKKFGKGFFDSLNNFRIPKFNTGGIVEVGNSLISGEASETVRHALELTINGSQKGQLTGSSTTISDILNDLALAKLRS